MERGLKFPPKEKTKTTNALLISLMNQLEKFQILYDPRAELTEAFESCLLCDLMLGNIQMSDLYCTGTPKNNFLSFEPLKKPWWSHIVNMHAKYILSCELSLGLRDKKSLKLGPDDNLHIEGFALNVFAKADKQDRAGRADLNTAKTFYAASIFFEILNQFGELQPDLEQKQKYAVWKAADIRKALKEGRRPEPGPPGGEDLSVPSNEASGTSDLGPSDSYPANQPGGDTSPRYVDNVNQQSSMNTPTSTSSYHSDNYSSSYPSEDYPSHDFSHGHVQTPPPPPPPPAPPAGRSEDSSYPQPYHHQPSHSQEQSFPPTYPSHEGSAPSYSYSNFQSYPGFSESSLPSAPGHYPSYYQSSDVAYTHQPSPPASGYSSTVLPHQSSPSPPASGYSSTVLPHQSSSGASNYLSTVQAHQSGSPAANYPSASQYDSGNRNGTQPEPAPSLATSFVYDSNYQPAPEKIAEAHKAARFAVGALAFDDVAIAVDYLRRSLELLTNPSASH
ncbi:hypothetical protein ACLOJK_035780 [Asimina triloba]